MKNFVVLILISFSLGTSAQQFERDTYTTSAGELAITFVGHGTLMFEWNGMIIHVDPVMRETDYVTMPDADLILITHHHGDHLDNTAINEIASEETRLIAPQKVIENLDNINDLEVVELNNGEKTSFKTMGIFAIPAYNMVHKRDNGEFYHPKGIGNGYVLSFSDKRVLVAGDTENIPEIKQLKDIDIAFLPMNLPYTMTPEMVADAAKAFKPAVLYPYHYGSTDTGKLVDLMKDVEEVEVKIRDL